jgi:CheY-like chemotaxis protein
LAAPLEPAGHPPQAAVDQVAGKSVLVIDDDALVLDSMRGMLKSWGCSVVAATTEDTALTALSACEGPPDIIISDYRLTDGKTGFDAIARIRRAFGVPIPAFLISGDTAPERLREARASGYYLLHKPVLPITLRAVVSQLLKDHSQPERGAQAPVPLEQATAQQSAAASSPALRPQ